MEKETVRFFLSGWWFWENVKLEFSAAVVSVSADKDSENKVVFYDLNILAPFFWMKGEVVTVGFAMSANVT